MQIQFNHLGGAKILYLKVAKYKRNKFTGFRLNRKIGQKKLSRFVVVKFGFKQLLRTRNASRFRYRACNYALKIYSSAVGYGYCC